MQPSSFALAELSLVEFSKSNISDLVGELAIGLTRIGFADVSGLQLESWVTQVLGLQRGIVELICSFPKSSANRILLEYTIPVIRRRLDAVILHDDKVIVIEYKGGNSTSACSALKQAQDYALDLKDFQEYCRNIQIFPIALGNFEVQQSNAKPDRGCVASPKTLGQLLAQICGLPINGDLIDQQTWSKARYFPVPQVVEAAVAAFNGHSVENIAISRADPNSLDRSKKLLTDAVATAKKDSSKILCVLTGVPGAGKTLTGLNAVSKITSELNLDEEQAVYLSGNTPLVKVLREALYRDRKKKNLRVTKAKLEVMIQEMHRFVLDNHLSGRPPVPRMIIFDEAQRAWSLERNLKKFDRNSSEPSMILEIMDRIQGWAVIVALVGGGQEIHDGEAGLEEWGRAIMDFPHWKVWTSPAALDGGPAVAGSRLFSADQKTFVDVKIQEELHLDVSLRSLDSEYSAAWVNAALSGDHVSAFNLAKNGLPIYVCRDLQNLKNWLLAKQIGSRRTGLVASSAAERLRAYGVETPTFGFMQGIDYVRWFLDELPDVRSSNQLEVAMSEFEVQGLELDYVGLVWGPDLIFPNGQPLVRKFGSNQWKVKPLKSSQGTGSDRAKREGLNRYRVLMTRYRKEMVIYVPKGDAMDSTRSPEDFDSVYEYLNECGIRDLVTSNLTIENSRLPVDTLT